MLSMKDIDDFQDVEMHVSMLWILIDCKNRPNINNKHVNLKSIDETTIYSAGSTCNNVFIQIL